MLTVVSGMISTSASAAVSMIMLVIVIVVVVLVVIAVAVMLLVYRHRCKERRFPVSLHFLLLLTCNKFAWGGQWCSSDMAKWNV